MLILILFWVAIVLAFASWLGSIAESQPSLMTAALVFCGLALVAAVVDGATWL